MKNRPFAWADMTLMVEIIIFSMNGCKLFIIDSACLKRNISFRRQFLISNFSISRYHIFGLSTLVGLKQQFAIIKLNGKFPKLTVTLLYWQCLADACIYQQFMQSQLLNSSQLKCHWPEPRCQGCFLPAKVIKLNEITCRLLI